MKKLSLLAAFVGLASPLFGQNSPLPVLPDGPLVRLRAPEVSRWIVTYNPQRAGGAGSATESSEPASGGQGTFSKKIVYTKNKNVILEQSLVPSRPVRDRWIVGEYQYSKNAKTKRYLPYTADSFPTGNLDPHFYVDLRKTDFPGVEWINKEAYAGIQKVMKRDCIVYRQQGDGNATAYVDLASRYPVALKHGSETAVFDFQQPAQISLPAEIQEDLKTRTPPKRP